MIAVTGATGLLGSLIINHLTDAGQQVIALSRNPTHSRLPTGNVIWRQADVTDAVSLHEALQQASGVIHAAALVSFNPRHRKVLFETNVIGTRNVVDACLTLNINRLVHISSVAALGRQPHETRINENHPWTESPINTHYAETKYRSELEIFRGQEEGLSTAILNPSVILAPGNWNHSSAQLFKYVWRQMPFYIDGSLNYIDGRDAAALAVKLYQSNIQGERFIASAGAVPFKTFFDETAARLHRKPPYLKVSGRLLRLLSALEQVRAWLGGNPLITRETAQLAGHYFLYDNHKITSRFDFSFQSFEATLDWCCAWYLKQINNQNNR
jgi:nucleoside-diphosphate-sugar epimerase